MKKGDKVHFDGPYAESPGAYFRATGDGVIVSRVRNDVKTVVVEVTRAVTTKIRVGDRIRLNKEFVTTEPGPLYRIESPIGPYYSSESQAHMLGNKETRIR